MSRLVPLLVGITVALAPAAASAHDYWIQPSDFTVAVGQKVPLRLLVGTKGDVTEHPYNKKFSVRFEAIGPSGKITVAGANYYRPAGSLVGRKAGVHTVVFRSKHSYIELAAEKFKKYLIEEGLTNVLSAREKAGQAGDLGRESYVRYCKALVRVGDNSTGYDRQVGLPLEVTAIDDPFAAKAGGKVRFLLTENGKPLANAQVELMSLTDVSIRKKLFTDKRGRVRFKIPSAGKWMVASTQMHRAPSGVKGDWESSWATLTFELPR